MSFFAYYLTNIFKRLLLGTLDVSYLPPPFTFVNLHSFVCLYTCPTFTPYFYDLLVIIFLEEISYHYLYTSNYVYYYILVTQLF
jgi:hypothetical protein